MKGRSTLIALSAGLSFLGSAAVSSAQTENDIKIGGAVYTFNLESDGNFHLRGYACNRKGTPADQQNHPDVEVSRDAPVTYDDKGKASGPLLKSSRAENSGSIRDEAVACDYVHEDSPPESFWRNMRFDISFTRADLAPLLGKPLFVSGAWHPTGNRVPPVQAAQLANSPVMVPPTLPAPPLNVTCAGPNGDVLTGDTVTWAATASGGTGIYAFAWTDDDIHRDATKNSTTANWPTFYTGPGGKTATVTLSDQDTSVEPTRAECGPVTVFTKVNSAVLPGSRSVVVNTAGTAFLSAIVGNADAHDCTITPSIDTKTTAFFFQETDPKTNLPTTTPQNTRFNLTSLVPKTFLVSLTPTVTFAPTEVMFAITCQDGSRSRDIVGINTLSFSSSPKELPVADLLAIAATASSDGILRFNRGVGAFAVATENIGAVNGFIAFVSDSSKHLASLAICQTDAQGQCKSPPVPSNLSFVPDVNDQATFAIFASPNALIPLDPEHSRISVTFNDVAGVLRGRTSVAVTTDSAPQ